MATVTSVPPLRKALGQHHLVDGALCRPLVDFLEPVGQRVVEVGPGGGVLTAELLAAGARVLAWELDPAWAAVVVERFPAAPLEVVVGDARELPWERLPTGTRAAGNLPYNVATVIIARLLPHYRRVSRAAFLVQREVARRLVAGPGEEDYGALAVLVRCYGGARVLGRVRRGSFRPPPKVDGAFVGFTLAPPPLSDAQMEAFVPWLRELFTRRRKTVKNALGAMAGEERARAALAAGLIDPRCRAETLTPEELLALYQGWRSAGAGGEGR